MKANQSTSNPVFRLTMYLASHVRLEARQLWARNNYMYMYLLQKG